MSLYQASCETAHPLAKAARFEYLSRRVQVAAGSSDRFSQSTSSHLQFIEVAQSQATGDKNFEWPGDGYQC